MTDAGVLWVLKLSAGLLIAATVTGFGLNWSITDERKRANIVDFQRRTASWWLIVFVLGMPAVIGLTACVLTYAVLSMLAFNEFVSPLWQSSRDKPQVLAALLVFSPVQYLLLWIGAPEWQGFWTPAAGLILSGWIAWMGDTRDYLSRVAALQWGLLVCVYALSHVPALLLLHIRGYPERNISLMLFLVLVVEVSDVFQYVCGKLFGRRPLAKVSVNKTWEGLIGGVACATALGYCVFWLTPFSPWQAAMISFAVTITGFFGGLTMAAVKRDRGVKDFAGWLPGIGGVTDRMDSLCFAAPLFYVITSRFFVP